GNLTKDVSATSTLILSGNNTYTGSTTVGSGTLIAGSTTALGSNSAVTSDGTLDLNGFDISIGSLAGTGTVTNSTTGTTTLTTGGNNLARTFSGVLQDGSGVTQLAKTGTSTQALSGTNTYTGTTTVDSGRLQISGAGSLGSGSYAGGIALGAGTTFQYSSSAAQRLTGVISGAGSLVKDTSTSTLTLGIENIPLTNTYSGGTTLSAGTIHMTPQNDSLLGTGTVTLDGGTLRFDRVALTNNIINNGATLYLENGFGSSLAGNITNNALLNVVVQFTRQNITGVISGSGGLAVTSLNGGSLALSGANTYTGSTSVDSGTLIAGSTTALGSNSAVTANGTLDLNGFDISIGSLVGSGTVSNSTATTTTLATGGNNTSTTFSGVIQNGSGTTLFTKTGTGTQTLSGTNTYTGTTTVSAGTLRAGSSTAFGSNSAVTANGTLDLNGFDISIGSLAGSGAVSNSTATTKTLTTGGNNTSTTFSGVIQNGSGITRFTKTGTGTQTLSGTNTYTGATTVSAGALTLEGAWSVGTGMADVAVAAGSVLSGSGTLTAGQLSVGGLGTVSLTGSNLVGTIAGNGTVGTLTFNNSQSLNVGSMDATGSVLLTSTGVASDLTLSNGAFLTSTAAGNAITLAAGRHFINQSNGSALSTPSGRWLVYSDTPADTVLGGLTGFKRYNLSYSSNSSASISQPGSGFIYSIAPVLTVAANSKSRIYGDSNPLLDGTIIGLIDGDTLAAATSGSAAYSTAASSSTEVGAYAIQAELGTLVSDMGYQFSTQNGTLSIDQRAITVSADAKSKVYGNVDPTLTYSVNSGNLVNGDTLNGALNRTVGENVGTYTIDASALQNGNYLITAQNGTLSIDQRAITVAADAKNKVYGNVDPTLTYSVNSGNLVNGDTLNGALTRTAGENVGTYTIDASALQNGNYLITAQNGTLNVTTRPLTIATDAKINLNAWDNCNLTSCNANEADVQPTLSSRQLLSVVNNPGDSMVLMVSGDSVRLDHLPQTIDGNGVGISRSEQ
ncbi:MAG: MBG domain-containing protein, partial [Limnobacter sp.]|uniref:beta strand repeat-containing protein n=1 Tax=Limnobacter sp. TaxID=2003368 RepID=UPI0032EB40F3